MDVDKTYFISGHLDLTQEEFESFYLYKILEIFRKEPNARFIVGDAKGADTWCQIYLKNIYGKKSNRVTVYHMFEFPRNNEGNFPTIGGFTSDEKRDSAMTLASDEDIAWVRPGRNKSGTAKNLERREKNNGLL